MPSVLVPSVPVATVTVQKVIKRAMRLIGVSGIGETLSADEAVDGLAALNSMHDSWGTEKNALYQIETLSHVPTAQSFTVGENGDLMATRPLKILSAYRRSNGVDTEVAVVGRDEYERISQKADGGLACAIYYKPENPNGVVYCWPVPSGETLFLSCQQPLEAFTSLTDALYLPPGYEEALTFGLAVYFAPEFEKEASPTVQRRAMTSKRLLKRVNVEIPQLSNEVGTRYYAWGSV
jgi:hypothetical protein